MDDIKMSTVQNSAYRNSGLQSVNPRNDACTSTEDWPTPRISKFSKIVRDRSYTSPSHVTDTSQNSSHYRTELHSGKDILLPSSAATQKVEDIKECPIIDFMAENNQSDRAPFAADDRSCPEQWDTKMKSSGAMSDISIQESVATDDLNTLQDIVTILKNHQIDMTDTSDLYDFNCSPDISMDASSLHPLTSTRMTNESRRPLLKGINDNTWIPHFRTPVEVDSGTNSVKQRSPLGDTQSKGSLLGDTHSKVSVSGDTLSSEARIRDNRETMFAIIDTLEHNESDRCSHLHQEQNNESKHTKHVDNVEHDVCINGTYDPENISEHRKHILNRKQYSYDMKRDGMDGQYKHLLKTSYNVVSEHTDANDSIEQCTGVSSTTMGTQTVNHTGTQTKTKYFQSSLDNVTLGQNEPNTRPDVCDSMSQTICEAEVQTDELLTQFESLGSQSLNEKSECLSTVSDTSTKHTKKFEKTAPFEGETESKSLKGQDDNCCSHRQQHNAKVTKMHEHLEYNTLDSTKNYFGAQTSMSTQTPNFARRERRKLKAEMLKSLLKQVKEINEDIQYRTEAKGNMFTHNVKQPSRWQNMETVSRRLDYDTENVTSIPYFGHHSQNYSNYTNGFATDNAQKYDSHADNVPRYLLEDHSKAKLIAKAMPSSKSYNSHHSCNLTNEPYHKMLGERSHSKNKEHLCLGDLRSAIEEPILYTPASHNASEISRHHYVNSGYHSMNNEISSTEKMEKCRRQLTESCKLRNNIEDQM
ncbi:unnamed protein product [Owenia fusiformis]|uniref:Uncharacterized protein n=1 Tax=Owenia fusiformis TaxID=6347 RepID=A0A8S4QBX3_OWEFU|nr:unnamed protein product [Owenia fusiformis]